MEVRVSENRLKNKEQMIVETGNVFLGLSKSHRGERNKVVKTSKRNSCPPL